MSSFILLNVKGGMKLSTVDIESKGTAEAGLAKVLKRAKAPALLGTWMWQKYKIFLYGYKEGRAGTESKHELPPPHDEVVMFGDACIIASLDKSADKPSPFTLEQYKKFFNHKIGGAEENAEENDDDDDGEDDIENDDEDEEDFDEEEDEVVGEEEDESGPIGGGDDEEEEEDMRPALRIKPSTGFKKIAKWMYAQELKPDDYPL
jgi:hypothetical protein